MTSPVGRKLDRNWTNLSDGGPRRPSMAKTERVFSGPSDRKLSTIPDRKQSVIQERKSSATERKYSPSERKHSSSERKHSSSERRQSVYVGRKQSINCNEPRKTSIDNASRKMSTFGERRSSINTERRSSLVESSFGTRSALIMTSSLGQRPSTGVKYEPSYRMEPTQKVKSTDIKKSIREVFEDELPGQAYVKDEICKLSKRLAEAIKQRVKFLGYFRHKIVCVVAIGQIEHYQPSVAFTSRCVWNEHFDTFEEYTFKNDSIYAVGMVYVLYAE